MPNEISKGSIFRHRPCRYSWISVGSLIAILLLSSIPLLASDVAEAKDGYFGGGSGTKGDPYIIEDVWDLQNMSRDLSAHYVLGNDIDASDTINWNSGAGFDPIGIGWISFTGTFDGRKFTITGFFINRPLTDYVGLFGSIGKGGIVKNIGLIDNNVRGQHCVGSLVGYNDGGIIFNCYATGNVSGSSFLGGLVGIDRGTVNNSYYNVEKLLINGGHHLTIGALYDAQYQDWFSNDMTLNISDYSASLVPSGGYYNLCTVQGFRDLLGFANVKSYRFRLAADIDLSNDTGFYIPYFSAAEFDGYNHTISNLHLNMSFAACVGMFGYIARSVQIRDLGIIDSQVDGYYYVGGLIGCSSGTVSNCFTTGNVSGYKMVGGLVGQNDDTISNCYTTGTVSGNFQIGGLVGSNWQGTVTNCYSTGTTSGSDSYVGGLIGSSSGTVSNCYATGKVSGYWHVGGLLGYLDKGTISKSFYDMDTTGQSDDVGKGSPKTTLEMKTKSTFISADWDLVNVWFIMQSITYPHLRWQYAGYPYADAGPDQVVDEGVLVIFNGSRSWDNSGVLNYTWRFTDRDEIELFGVQPTYQFNTPGVYLITLAVSNLEWKKDIDTVTITVNDVIPPIANAGPDKIVDEGTTVTLNGNMSFDSGGILNWTWTFRYDSENIVLYGIVHPYIFNIPGFYPIELKVTDYAGHWNTVTVNITVMDITPPVANAGMNQSVDEWSVVIFNGSGSYDNVGIVNYVWRFYDREMITLYGINPSHRFKTPGEYTVVLNISDAADLSATDMMTVTVRDITAPIAVSGPDLTVDEGTDVSFDGSRSYDNVGITNYTWMFIDGDPIFLYGIDPNYQFDNPGVYTVVLNVTDPAGLWSIDSITVTVRDITPPVANAGEDRTIYEGGTVQFDGSGSDDNVKIDNYTWKFIGIDHIILHGVDPTYRFDTPGVYTFFLKVTDAVELWSVDSITITVRDITPPVADAGEDLTIDEGGTVQFDGNGSSDNVGIVNYTWAFNDGSANVILYGIHTSHTFPIPGTYTITLTVRDEAGNDGSVTMTVEVKEKEKTREALDDLWLYTLGPIIVLGFLLIFGWFLLFRGTKRGDRK